jgi:hypothetical protein
MSKVTKGVYCLTSPSGKKYVGVGTSKGGIESRWDQYKNLRSSVKTQPKLYNALKKYGPENFKYEVILETNDRKNALRSEMYLIDVWDLQNPEKGYNITAGGQGFFSNHSEESKRKMSQSAKESYKNGRKPSKSAFKKGCVAPGSAFKKGCVGANSGKKASEETKRKLSESHMGKPGYWTGKKRVLSEQHLINIKVSAEKRNGIKRGPYKKRTIL